MRAVALKGLAGRKVRSLLTAFAVVLGVAMVSGTYVLTDTISSAFDDIFTGSYAKTSAVITGREVVKGSTSGNPTIPDSLLARVREVPGVAAAAGSLADVSGNGGSNAKIIGRDGKAISNGGAPTFGFGVDATQPRFNPLHLVSGDWAQGSGQVVLDAATSKKEHYGVGDKVQIAAVGPQHTYTVSGVAKYGSVNSLGGATIAVWDVPTAQAVLGKRGQLDEISIAAKPGVSETQLVGDIRPLLPGTATVKTGAAQAAANAKDTKEVLNYLRYALLAFGVIALFVGAFVIFNTLSITVAQRAREFATLRTLGASRRQVLRSVLLEAFVLGVLASLTGLALGVALAKGLSALMKALSLDLPQAGTVFASRTVIVSLLLGITITMLASLAPALRATRVPPIAAVREGGVLPPSRLARWSGPGAIGLTVAAIAALVVGSLAGLGTGPTLILIALGCLTLFVGVALVSPRLVRPLAAALGAPARRFGGPAGKLAQGNATRNPGRTATTAAALMIGLALVTLVATIGQGLRASDRKALESQVKADYVVTSQSGFEGFSAQASQALPAIPGVGAASAVLEDRARMFGDAQRINGIDPATAARTLNFPWKHGSDAALRDLGADGAIIKESFADDHNLGVGDQFTATSPSGHPLSLRVAGITDPPVFDKIDAVLSDVVISREAFVSAFPRPKVTLALIDVDGGATAQATSTLKHALGPFADAKLETKAGWVTTRSGGIDKLLNLLYVLLALSVVVSLFGMVNTLVLAVFERTREIGMLRAIGMTRRQIRRMIRQESVITALIGAALGLPIGLGLAALFTHALADQGLAFSLPIGPLIVFAIVAVLAGIGAAIVPARRAARLDVLTALQYE